MKKKIGTILWVIGLCMACNEDANYINFIGVGVFWAGKVMIMKGGRNGTIHGSDRRFNFYI